MVKCFPEAYCFFSFPETVFLCVKVICNGGHPWKIAVHSTGPLRGLDNVTDWLRRWLNEEWQFKCPPVGLVMCWKVCSLPESRRKKQKKKKRSLGAIALGMGHDANFGIELIPSNYRASIADTDTDYFVFVNYWSLNDFVLLSLISWSGLW